MRGEVEAKHVLDEAGVLPTTLADKKIAHTLSGNFNPPIEPFATFGSTGPEGPE